ncbi:hypothetical protein KGY58_04535 [Candidatus Bipolaricaulota bacterium]|nr:hypothetical protein [Candidatus Bipolaricaulota bacterium]
MNQEDETENFSKTGKDEESRNEVLSQSSDFPEGEVPDWEIVKLYKNGATKEEIGERFPGLSERKITLAVSSYYCNRRKIENRIKKNEN